MMRESENGNGPKEIRDRCKGFGALSDDNVDHVQEKHACLLHHKDLHTAQLKAK